MWVLRTSHKGIFEMGLMGGKLRRRQRSSGKDAQRPSEKRIRTLDLPSFKYLSELQAERYQTGSLVGVSPAEFQSRLEAFQAMDDWQSEGYQALISNAGNRSSSSGLKIKTSARSRSRASSSRIGRSGFWPCSWTAWGAWDRTSKASES
jgi:hypothetical protein